MKPEATGEATVVSEESAPETVVEQPIATTPLAELLKRAAIEDGKSFGISPEPEKPEEQPEAEPEPEPEPEAEPVLAEEAEPEPAEETEPSHDLTFTEQGRDLSETIDELRHEGLALLLRDTVRENCGIAIHYSLLSVRGHWITEGHVVPHEHSDGEATSPHLKRFEANRHAWLQALEDAGYQYDFLTTEQIEEGKLPNYRVLILPDSLALSEKEAGTIRKFVHGGGLLIADAETGLMNGHASWQHAGSLDEVFGVKRSELRSAASDLPLARIQVELGGETVRSEVMPADPAIRVTTGRGWTSTKGTPLLIENAFGAGRSTYFNFWMTDYGSLRLAGQQEERLVFIRQTLAQNGIQPVANFRTTFGQPLRCSEVVSFRKGAVKYLVALPEPNCADTGPVLLQLATPQYVYDLRSHRLLGHLSRVEGVLKAGEPLVLALSGIPLAGVKLSRLASSNETALVKAGGAVKFLVQLDGDGTSNSFDSAVHIEVHNPSGNVVDYYGGDYALSGGRAEFSIPLALDDAPGRWQVDACEPFSRQTARTSFELVPP